MCLTWDGVGKSVGVFGDECVLNVSSAHSMGPWQRHTQSVIKADAQISCCYTQQYSPNKTSVFLLKAGSFTTSSYVTRSSWSNTGSETEKQSKRMWRGAFWDTQQLEWGEQGVLKRLKHIWWLCGEEKRKLGHLSKQRRLKISLATSLMLKQWVEKTTGELRWSVEWWWVF